MDVFGSHWRMAFGKTQFTQLQVPVVFDARPIQELGRAVRGAAVDGQDHLGLVHVFQGGRDSGTDCGRAFHAGHVAVNQGSGNAIGKLSDIGGTGAGQDQRMMGVAMGHKRFAPSFAMGWVTSLNIDRFIRNRLLVCFTFHICGQTMAENIRVWYFPFRLRQQRSIDAGTKNPPIKEIP